MVGHIIILTVIMSILKLVTLGQHVNHNAIHLEHQCYVSLILPRTLGLLINCLNLNIRIHKLVTLIFKIRMATMSGYLVVVVLIRIGISILIITAMIVLI